MAQPKKVTLAALIAEIDKLKLAVFSHADWPVVTRIAKESNERLDIRTIYAWQVLAMAVETVGQ